MPFYYLKHRILFEQIRQTRRFKRREPRDQNVLSFADGGQRHQDPGAPGLPSTPGFHRGLQKHGLRRGLLPSCQRAAREENRPDGEKDGLDRLETVTGIFRNKRLISQVTKCDNLLLKSHFYATKRTAKYHLKCYSNCLHSLYFFAK